MKLDKKSRQENGARGAGEKRVFIAVAP